MALNFTTTINGTDCIGDSRTTINNNFSALDTTIQNFNTSLSSASLSARFITLAHSPFNDFINPNLFIGEVGDGTPGSVSGSLSGFNTTYDESINKFIISTQFGATPPLTGLAINSIAQVGINTVTPNQTLTVNGTISATGFASVSALQINNATTSSTLLSSLNAVYKFPIYNSTGTLLGFIPICNF
jgi:hypothetical protein